MSWPPSFIQRMKRQLGEDFASFLSALDTETPVSLRVNSAKLSGNVDLEKVPWARDAYYLPYRPVFTLDPSLHGGGYYVQEASSMFLMHALGALGLMKEGVRILDLCGAPGGKSTLLASLLPDDGLLLSNEVIRGRANILLENLQKWGREGVLVSNNDPEDFQSLPGFFDLMLIDAPCSGEGLFRRDPAAADAWSDAQVQFCAQRQRRILMDSWECLKPGGILIYSTCTYNLEENEDNLAWLAAEEELESLKVEIDPNWGIREKEVKGIWGYRFLPHCTRGEGLFMAVLRKGERGKEFRFKKAKKSGWSKLDKGEEEVFEWTKKGEELYFFKEKEGVHAIPQSQRDALEALDQRLHLLQKGLEMAAIKKKNKVPSPALALSSLLREEAFSRMELNHEEALNYLAKKPLDKEMEKGWNLLVYRGLGLGWGKQVGQRINNYYPQHWRIRMNIPDENRWFDLREFLAR